MTFSDISQFKPKVLHEHKSKLKKFFDGIRDDDWMLRRYYDEDGGIYSLIIISSNAGSIPVSFPTKQLAEACYDFLIKQ